MNKKAKKFNWTRLIVIILILSLVGTGIWFFFFRKEKAVTYQEFKTQMNESAKSPTDNKWLETNIDESYSRIYVSYHNAGNTSNYSMGLSRAQISALTDPDTLQKYKAELAAANQITTPTTTPAKTTVAPVKVIIKPASYIFEQASLESGKGHSLIQYHKAPSIWVSLLSSMLPMLIFIGIYIWMMSKMGGGSQGGVFKAGANKAKRVKSSKTFKDVAGNEEVKEEARELVDYLKNPGKYKAAGARIPKGMLLGGPPGTGKTLIAKAVAGEANVPFYFISGSNFVEMFVGVGAKRVREMFKEVRANSPAILFIDEIDAVGRSRGAGVGGGNDEREQTLNQLLVEMDGMEESVGVLIIAATNRADVLDPALQRPGRFDRTITVGLPDVKERHAILEVHAKGKRISPDANLAQVAKRTPGYSGAQLENVVNEASLLSVREDTGVITIAQLDEAIDRVMSGPAKKSRTISKEELTRVAYHEAGHAIIGMRVPGADKVQKITIIPRGDAGGYTIMMPDEEKFNYSKTELEKKIMSFMGGRAAEQVFYGVNEVTTGASNDIERATQISRTMVTQFGMSELGPIQYESAQSGPFMGRDLYKNKDFSDKVGYEIDLQVRKIIQKAEIEAMKVIKANKPFIEKIKDVLLEKETIVAEEIAYLDKHGKLPPVSKVQIKAKEVSKLDLNSVIEEAKKQSKNTAKPVKKSPTAKHVKKSPTTDDKKDTKDKLD